MLQYLSLKFPFIVLSGKVEEPSPETQQFKIHDFHTEHK